MGFVGTQKKNKKKKIVWHPVSNSQLCLPQKRLEISSQIRAAVARSAALWLAVTPLPSPVNVMCHIFFVQVSTLDVSVVCRKKKITANITSWWLGWTHLFLLILVNELAPIKAMKGSTAFLLTLSPFFIYCNWKLFRPPTILWRSHQHGTQIFLATSELFSLLCSKPLSSPF